MTDQSQARPFAGQPWQIPQLILLTPTPADVALGSGPSADGGEAPTTSGSSPT